MTRPIPSLTAEDLVRHASFVRRVARDLVRDEQRADDLTQDTLLVALERPPGHAGNLQGWLRRVVRSLASKGWRAERRRRRLEERTSRSGTHPATADTAARLELQRTLVEAVQALSEPYRSTVMLRYFDGLKLREVARREAVPVKTVQTRLRRAMGLLRGRLDHLYGGDRKAWSVGLLPFVGRRTMWAGAGGQGFHFAGVLIMAGKLSFALGGFLFGVGATVLCTQIAEETAPSARADKSAAGHPASATRPSDAIAERDPELAKPSDGRRRGSAEELSAEDYLRRINQAPDPAAALSVAQEIAGLPGTRGRDIMRVIYRDIAEAAKRQEVLDAFATGPGHPYALDVLDLAAGDREPAVKGVAFDLLRQFAFRDFQENPDAYRTWRQRFAGLPLEEVLRINAQAFVDRLRVLDGPALQRELRLLRRPPNPEVGRSVGVSLASVLQEASLPAAVARWIAPAMPSEDSEPQQFYREREIRRAVWRWLEAAEPDETFLRQVVVPILEDGPRRHVEETHHAARVLGGVKRSWAFETLVGTLRRTPPRTTDTFALGRALAESGGQRAIPYLIAAIAKDNTYATVYGLGHFGLRNLTGVRYDESHTGQWWLDWWDRNRDSLPPDVRAIDPRMITFDW